MKVKGIHDRKSGSQTLCVRAQRNEELDYAQAEWLKGSSEPYLIDFTYVLEASGATLYYDVTGMSTLPRYLKTHSLTSAQYRSMVKTVFDAVALCTQRGFPTSSMLFDWDEVRVTADGELRLAYVPLTGVASTRENAPSALLNHLADRRRVGFVVADDARHAAALYDFVKRNAVLSLSACERFLADEFGIGGSGSLGAAAGSGSLSARPQRPAPARRVPARPGAEAAPPRMAFDPVAMLTGSSAASDIVAAQAVSSQVIDGVGGLSPTAAGRVAPVAAASPAAPAAPAPAEQGAPEPPLTTLLGGPAAPTRREGRVPSRAFVVRAATGERIEVPADGAYHVVGRSVTSELTVGGNGNISRRHAELAALADGLHVRDAGSANGSFVGNRRLAAGTEAAVGPGESFRLADEVFRYEPA